MHIISERTDTIAMEGVIRLPSAPEKSGQAAKPDFLHELAVAVSAEIESLRDIRELPPAPSPFIYDLVKRGFDLVCSTIGLILLSPVFLIVSIWVKRDTPGPVFYCQERTGLNGRSFKMIKFRTMVADAEKSTGPVWAKEGDPRVTRAGRFLRQCKLDELPQLINVVKGEMSLVGPRPERPAFVELFGRTIPGYGKRHQIRPGITGLAQLENGYDKEARDVLRKLQYDVSYIYERDLLMDLALIFRTIGRAIKGSA